MAWRSSTQKSSGAALGCPAFFACADSFCIRYADDDFDCRDSPNRAPLKTSGQPSDGRPEGTWDASHSSLILGSLEISTGKSGGAKLPTNMTDSAKSLFFSKRQPCGAPKCPLGGAPGFASGGTRGVEGGAASSIRWAEPALNHHPRGGFKLPYTRQRFIEDAKRAEPPTEVSALQRH